MDPALAFTLSALSALRSADTPTGHLGEALVPTSIRNLELTLARKSVKTKLDPLPAGRLITWIARVGKATSGLSLAICAAFQFLISPRKISASTSPESRSSRWTPGRL